MICWQQKTGLGDSTMATPPLRSLSSGSEDGDMTGEVGTALYISPEMMKGGSKLRYDQVSCSDLWVCLSVCVNSVCVSVCLCVR